MFKALDLWLPSYLKGRVHPGGATDVLISVCDHFEPLHATDKRGALARVKLWQDEYPKLIEPFRDSDEIRPRHTFFYPIEQYDAEIIEELSSLCALCGGEVEIHLHHDSDTPAGLTEKLERGKRQLISHNMLSHDEAGNVRYGFIHGNWALDNSDPQHKNCGVDTELEVLSDTGCYADFTMPSAPHPTQTQTINSLYYAKDSPKPKSHDLGEPARVLPKALAAGRGADTGRLLLVQGPLGLNWERRKFSILPKIENGDLTGANPPTPERFRVWKRLGIHVGGRPEWIFIKLHTHGAHPRNSPALLGNPMRSFLKYLTSQPDDLQGIRFHFVSAREMVNILHAAEDGHSGNPGNFRDYRYKRLAIPTSGTGHPLRTLPNN